MNLNESPLWREIQAIFADGAKPVHYRWECEIHANGKTLNPYAFKGMEISRNYARNYSDTTILHVAIPPGDFNFYIWPYKDQIEVTIRRIQLNETGGDENTEAAIQTQRFKAITHEKGSGMVEMNKLGSDNREVSNLMEIKHTTFDLIDPVVDKIRFQSFGGIFRECTGADAIRAVLGLMSQQATVDKDTGVRGVNIAPGFNDKKRDHIVIPHGTKVTSVPLYIHEKCGGVYSTGFGCYLQKGMWYLFAPYDLEAYSKAKRTLTVVNLPKNRLPGVERSYRVTDTQVILISNGEAKHYDNSEKQALNFGNGVRFTDASKVVKGFVSVEGNRAVASRSDNSVEMMSPRKDKVNNITLSNAKFTANIPFEKSKLAERAGCYVQFSWEQSLDDIIFPGMPVRYIFLQNENIQELHGTVVDAQHFITLNGTNLMAGKHQCNSAITLFLEQEIKLAEAS